MCLKHKRWLGEPQTDLTRFPEALVAQRHWRARLWPRGVLIECPAHLLALEAATVGISRGLLEERAERVDAPSPGPLVYPETVALTRLVTRKSFLDAVLGDATPRWKRAMVEREVKALLPDAPDAENWSGSTTPWTVSRRTRRWRSFVQVSGWARKTATTV